MSKIQIGELTRRVWIRKWMDVPNGSFGITQVVDVGIRRFAKIQPVSGVLYWGTKQVGEEITHKIFVRYAGCKPESITGAHVVEAEGRRYRVKRATDVEDRKFTMIEVTDIGNIA